jgi:hypothetical protein
MTPTHVASLITSTSILVYLDGEQFAVNSDHPNFTAVRDDLREKRYDRLTSLINIEKSVQKWLDADREFTLEGGLVVYDGRPFSSAVTDKVVSMIDAGNDPEPIFNFLRKVRNNPSFTSQEELLLFMVANGFLIHEDGDIIAYKSVRGDYTDIYSGKVRNMIGDRPSMPRWSVDDNRNNTCSSGFHFASHQYATTWSGAIDGVNRRLMVMKINPADVVSIPSDYNNQKARCCCYEVIGEIETGTPLPKQEVYSEGDLRQYDSRYPTTTAFRQCDDCDGLCEEDIDCFGYDDDDYNGY